MATNLFGKYYDNPTKSYIYTNLQCNGASADEMTFSISGSDGVISNAEDVLSSIGLDEISVPLTQYTNDMRIIDPYSFIYVRGFDYGDSYTVKAYGRLVKKAVEDEDWMYKTTAAFIIKYLSDCGVKKTLCVCATGSLEDDQTFIEKIQSVFDENDIKITVTYDNGYIYFTATELAYDFWIEHVMIIQNSDSSAALSDILREDYNQYGLGYSDEWTEDNEVETDDVFSSINVYSSVITQEDYQEAYRLISYMNSEDNDAKDERVKGIFLFEDLSKYVPHKKYRNGAMQGCVVVATYPEYNDEDIDYTQRSLRIGHLRNRVADYHLVPSAATSGVPIAVRTIRDVVDTYHSEYEYDLYKKWSNECSQINTRDEWIDPDEIPHVIPELPSDWEHSHVPVDYVAGSIYRDNKIYDAIGLYGYCTWLTKTDNWLPMGQVYMRTTVPDDASLGTRNLMHSFIVYNPNPFPVTVKYMTFA